jgi:hypothetical protein
VKIARYARDMQYDAAMIGGAPYLVGQLESEETLWLAHPALKRWAKFSLRSRGEEGRFSKKHTNNKLLGYISFSFCALICFIEFARIIYKQLRKSAMPAYPRRQIASVRSF